MRRRSLFALPLSLAVWPMAAQQALAQSGDTPDDAPAQPPGITISTQQMDTALAQRFPLRYPAPGIADMELQKPSLQLLPEQNRIAAEMAVQVAGVALQRVHQGTFEVDFALRYEVSDQSIRATRLQLRRLQFPTLPPNVVAMLNVYAPALAQRSMLEVVVHRLQAKDLALADGLGLQPGAITVTNAGVRIALVPKSTGAVGA